MDIDTSFEVRCAITDAMSQGGCIARAIAAHSKYDRQVKGVTIDVYDVLQAFNVTNPALQHLIKKALCAGLRGHKDRRQDLNEILESAKRAIELEKE